MFRLGGLSDDESFDIDVVLGFSDNINRDYALGVARDLDTKFSQLSTMTNNKTHIDRAVGSVTKIVATYSVVPPKGLDHFAYGAMLASVLSETMYKVLMGNCTQKTLDIWRMVEVDSIRIDSSNLNIKTGFNSHMSNLRVSLATYYDLIDFKKAKEKFDNDTVTNFRSLQNGLKSVAHHVGLTFNGEGPDESSPQVQTPTKPTKLH